MTLYGELAKPGLCVEWKKETQVLACGEKYQIKQRGLSYELQIFDLRPEDTGSYSCCAEETISSASLVVNGRMETIRLMLSSSIFHVFHLPRHSFIHTHQCTRVLCLNLLIV